MDPAPAPYLIRINGHLGAGLLDRSALYGVLAEIEALGLDLLEIQKLTPTAHGPR